MQSNCVCRECLRWICCGVFEVEDSRGVFEVDVHKANEEVVTGLGSL